MIVNKLDYLKNGEYKIGGYAKSIIDYTIQNQLLDEKTWALFVEQFRRHTDTGNDWKGEYWGKMMRGGCLTYSATKNEKLFKVLTATVKDMLSVQEKSGRISSRPENDEFRFWDLWCRKYILLGCEYYLEICKSDRLRKKIIYAMQRHANYIIKRIGEGKNKIGILETSSFFGALNSCSILEPMVKLYGLTGDKKYLDFSEYIVNTGCCKDFDLYKVCLKKELYPYQFPQTKAYEMMSCIEGILELYKYTENKDYFVAVENFIDMIVNTDYTITGSSACMHEFFDNSSITQTEPFKYELGQETCVTVTFIKLCAKMFAVTGEPKYTEFIEKSGYNVLFGAVNDQKQTMKNVKAAVEKENGEKYYPEHEAFPFDSYSPSYMDKRGKGIGGFKLLGNGRSYGCCACIGSAGTAIFGLFGIMKGESGYYINLFNDGILKTDDIKISVKANVYTKNFAKIKVTGKGKVFSVNIRKPSWAENIAIYIDGENVDFNEEKGYIKLIQEWNTDEIIVKFKSPIKMHLLNGKVAYTKGPIVLARDCRLDDIAKLLNVMAKDGKNVSAKIVKNIKFYNNVTVSVKTKDDNILLCDYSSAGKNYDEDNCKITVWQNVGNQQKCK